MNEMIVRAREIWASENLEIDDGALISESDDGVWVAAWVWVPKEELDAASIPHAIECA